MTEKNHLKRTAFMEDFIDLMTRFNEDKDIWSVDRIEHEVRELVSRHFSSASDNEKDIMVYVYIRYLKGKFPFDSHV